jgi:hypothetical protein
MKESTNVGCQDRIYYFPFLFWYRKLTIKNVAEFFVSDSGNHRLKTTNGILYIIPKGWQSLEIITPKKDWTI